MRIVALLVVLGLLPSLAAAGSAADAFEARVQPCAACHGEQGRATADGYYPRIAGKPAGYLFEQLLNFRDGRRVHAQMSYLVDRQREAYLRRMAEHFAAISLPYPAPVSSAREPAVLARGERLVRHGDPAAGIPSCNACHGERMTGIEPAVPGLVGLPYDYLVAQLGAWREHLRRARAPDCMAQVARDLSPADIEAVAAWLAAQPVPSPASAVHRPLQPPIACGSLEPRP